MKLSIFQVLVILSLTYSTGLAAFELSFVTASPRIYSAPHDITLSPDKKHLYVADNNNDRIAILDSSNLKLISTFGEGLLGAPHDVEFDQQGQLLVADTDNSRIAIFQLTGTKAKFIGDIRGQFSRPEGVAVHPDGRIYVTGAGSDDIEVFKNGKSIGHATGFSSPHDVVIASGGSVWIADAGNDRLVHMSHDLKVIKILKGEPYHFSGPRYLAFDDKDRLYVADKYSHQIKILSKAGEIILVLGTGNRGLGPGEFNRPEGIITHGNDVWFSDTYNNRIVKYQINN